MAETPDQTDKVEAQPEPTDPPSAESVGLPDPPETQDPVGTVAVLSQTVETEPATKKTGKRTSKTKTAQTAVKSSIEVERAEALGAQILELRAEVETEKEKRLQSEARVLATKEAARDRWLSDNGLVRDQFATLAPTVDEADPLTEEGRRALSKFRADNPELFKGTPNRPEAKPSCDMSVGGPRPSIGDMFKKVFSS
jgi:hypothetical protein